jgi:hypothetical protein
MMAGDDGWDDPVPLPEDDDASQFGHQPPPPQAAAPPPPPPATAPVGASSGGRSGVSRTVWIVVAGVVGVIVVLIVIGAVAGGGSSTLSHSQLVSKGNAICAKLATEVKTDQQNNDQAKFDSDLSDTIGKLSALKPPSQDAPTMKRIVTDLNNAVSERQSGNSSQATTDGNAADTLFGQVGLTTCATGT